MRYCSRYWGCAVSFDQKNRKRRKRNDPVGVYDVRCLLSFQVLNSVSIIA